MNIINKARELLVRQSTDRFGFSSFRTDICNIKYPDVILFDTFTGYAASVGIPADIFDCFKDGATIPAQSARCGAVYIVLTRVKPSGREEAEFRRANWTAAHEVGHVMLQHNSDDDDEEREADLFASEFLMPELVLLELSRRLGRELHTAEVTRLFSVSTTAARIRLDTLKRRSRFSTYLQEELLDKYNNLINNYTGK